MPQFLAEISGNNFTLNKDEARHLCVSRVRAGEIIKIFDGLGNKYTAKIEDLGPKSASGIITQHIPAVLPARDIILCFSAVSRPAAEDMLDKCTQVGIYAFQPIFSDRADNDLLKKWETKTERWGQILLAACKQCETPRIPKIYTPLTFAEAVKKYSPALICYEDEHKTSISKGMLALPGKELSIFIGPEGGYTAEEIALAAANKITPVTLGINILRAETAATTACWAVIQ